MIDRKDEPSICQEFNFIDSKPVTARNYTAEEEKKSLAMVDNIAMKDAHDKIIIADADSDDDESVDDIDRSFMTSRYISTYGDDISEGSGYQELQKKPASVKSSRSKDGNKHSKRK